MSEFQFFNPYDDIRFTANRLPHWQQKGAVYFVTFRLADAVPQHLREQWESDRKAWLRFHRHHGMPKPNVSITSVFLVRLSVGLMRVTARVFCDVPIAQQLLQKRYATLTATEFRKSRGW